MQINESTDLDCLAVGAIVCLGRAPAMSYRLPASGDPAS